MRAKILVGICGCGVLLGLSLILAAGEPARLHAAGAGEANNPQGTVSAALESTYLGFTYDMLPNGSRFFAARLKVANSGSRPATVVAREIVLRVDGADYRMKEIPIGLRNYTFSTSRRTVELSRVRTMEDLQVAAGKTAENWVVFSGIPAGVQTPAMLLRLSVGGKPIELNVNEIARGVLGLDVQRIGPRGSLALLTISGELNTVNAGALTGVLDSMAAQHVVRAVIRFTRKAAPLDGQILSWLQQAAYFAGRGDNTVQNLPVFPSALRELHLAGMPNQSAWNLEGTSGPQPRIHKTDAEAVRAALKSGFEVLSREELLLEINNGHALTRIAALREGGARLSAEDLPLVLRYADGSDPEMRLAALSALRHFGEKGAIDKLLEHARKNSEPTVSMAIESLAASRYAAAHRALLDVLKNEHPASRKLIVHVLAKYPRPIWGDTIYSFVSDPEPQVAVEALRALMQVGHPRLFDVLNDALTRGSPAVQEEAFQLLADAKVGNRQSEERAVEYALEKMKNHPPTTIMYELLARTKDPRAIPLLLAQLDRFPGSRTQIIATLAQIGDLSVADALADRYAGFSDRDKTATLNALQSLKSRQFRTLAAEALSQKDASLIGAAVIGLQNDGGPQAIGLLTDALDSSNNETVWRYVTNGLATFATAESKAALRKASLSANTTKRGYAMDALRDLWKRSPGFPYCVQAQQSVLRDRLDEAISNYSSSIELDAELPIAYSGRGHAYLQKRKLHEAHKDFSKALELDPTSSEAVTGLAICLVQEGELEQGIKLVENARIRMNDDYLFTYNAACVYGRALEQTLKPPHTPASEKKGADFREKALADLRRSVKLGFPQMDWMKKDPDLDSLHGQAEFKKIVSPDASSDENESGDDKSGKDSRPPGKGRKASPRKSKERGAGVSGIPSSDAIKADLLFESARP